MSVRRDLLRPEERGKIRAAERHFAALKGALGLDDLTYGLGDGTSTSTDAAIDEALAPSSG